MKRDVKVKVTLTEGYQKRFTEACLQVFQKRQKQTQQAVKLSSKVAG